MPDLTRLIDAAAEGDQHAAAELLPLVYDELRKLAATKMAQEQPGQTLDATGLVHEAYLRLVGHSALGDSPEATFQNRGHFFAAAAEAMRRILVEAARRKGRIKHGGLAHRIELDPEAHPANIEDHDLLDLHEALEKLAIHDPLKARLVELRFFAGLTLPDAAECLGISASTADRAWKYARAWLYTAMDGTKNAD